MSASKNVLCVLSQEQYQDYREELAKLSGVGAELVVENNPEAALERVTEVNPLLLLVGMEVGFMEGLEFLALLMNKHKDFERPAVVLPDKADGMPPVLHSRSLSTGHSSVDNVTFDQIAQTVARAMQAVQPAEAAPAPQPVEDYDAPSDIATQPHIDEPTASKPKWVIPAVVGGVVLLLIVVLIIFSGNGEEPAKPKDTGEEIKTAAVTDPVAKAEPAEPVAAQKEEPAAEAEAAKAEAPEKEEPTEEAASAEEPPDEPAEPALAEETILPIRFEIGKGRPKVSDEQRLKEIVKGLREQRDARIVLIGHTSNEGDAPKNRQLGLFRAKMVKKLLVRRGIPGGRIKLETRGEKEPIESNQTPGGRSKNRRVTLRLVH